MSDLPPEDRRRALPAHPDMDDTPDSRQQRTAVNWTTILVIALIGAFVIVILVLHLTGVVGPAEHG